MLELRKCIHSSRKSWSSNAFCWKALGNFKRGKKLIVKLLSVLLWFTHQQEGKSYYFCRLLLYGSVINYSIGIRTAERSERYACTGLNIGRQKDRAGHGAMERWPKYASTVPPFLHGKVAWYGRKNAGFRIKPGSCSSSALVGCLSLETFSEPPFFSSVKWE